jgi:exodeoxyribonuclease VII large subunit
MTLPLPLSSALAVDEVLSVRDLTASLKRVVEGNYGPLWVRGEVLQCRAPASGHWYFVLRDSAAQVRCTMWRTYAERAGRPPVDGTEVYALGRPDVYESKGELQFLVTRMLPTSMVGDQQRALELVKAALDRDGLFDQARKRPLPPYPARVAVVTSTDGAALSDIITVARTRWPSVKLFVVASKVQGEGATGELVAALRRVNRLDVELCIVGRGGGGREDLAAFNDEAVCRALAAVRVPTISAVGHETDVSLADLVADVRAATPSAAAELALPDVRAVRRLVGDLGARLAGGLSRRTRLASERLERTGDRLEAAMEVAIGRRHQTADRLAGKLDALSPLRVLERGYAVPLSASGRVLRRRADFSPGSPFTLRVADGDVAARSE